MQACLSAVPRFGHSEQEWLGTRGSDREGLSTAARSGQGVSEWGRGVVMLRGRRCGRLPYLSRAFSSSISIPGSVACVLLAAWPAVAEPAQQEEANPNQLPQVNVQAPRRGRTVRPARRGRRVATQPATAPAPQPQEAVQGPVTGTTTATPLNGNAVATSASRLGLSVRETPASVDVVGQQTIQEQGYRTVADTANGVTGVLPLDQAGAPSNFSMRGFF